jgi:hypothetical protein
VRDGRVFGAWRRTVPRELGDAARPVRFRDGELLVEVRSSAHLHELRTFTGEELRRRLNDALGRDFVRSIAFKLEIR